MRRHPEMLKQIQIEETLKAAMDPSAGLREEFDKRFRGNQAASPPKKLEAPEPVTIELDW